MVEEKETKKEGKKQDEASGKNSGEAEVPAKFRDIVEKIETMSVLDLSELVGVLEKKFNVSAQAVAAVAAAPAAGGAGEAGGGEEEKTVFNVELTAAGDQKIQVIKVVKEISGLGLKEAKDLVDGVPAIVKEGVKKAEAEELKSKIETAGGTVELK